MALLARAAALTALAGCYSPDLRDCTVTCASSADCVGSQICGADHFCSMPAKAGTCSRTTPDASITMIDASPAVDAHPPPPIDAHQPPPPPDAATLESLELVLMGHGHLVTGSHTCDTDCTYMLPLQPVDVVAVAGGDWMFSGWTVGPCIGSQSTTCTVTPPAIVGARFRKGDN
jgi:hypothetical protein